MTVIILGAGRKAEHLCDLFQLWSEVTQFYDEPRTLNETKRDKPVIDKIICTEQPIIVYSAVGEPRDKREIIQRFKHDAENIELFYTWGNKHHPTTVITNPIDIGIDFTIRELSSLGTQCTIGDHVSIGPLANISHHSVIGDYVTIAGGVNMSGGVTVGDGVFIGQGASIKPDIRIGKGAVIGTGAVVVKDVAPNSVVGGNPAKTNPKFRRVQYW